MGMVSGGPPHGQMQSQGPTGYGAYGAGMGAMQHPGQRPPYQMGGNGGPMGGLGVGGAQSPHHQAAQQHAMQPQHPQQPAVIAPPAKFKKAPDAPKRFKSAFIIFSAEKHKEIKSDLSKEGRSEKVSRLLLFLCAAFLF